MNGLLIREEHVATDEPVEGPDGWEDKSHSLGESDSLAIEKSIFADVPLDKLAAALYRYGLKEYGRCVSKVYVDSKDNNVTRHVGYVFQRQEPYDDEPKRTYLHEVWVTVDQMVACSTCGHERPERFYLDRPSTATAGN